MKHSAFAIIIMAFIAMSGCSGMSNTEQKTLSGAGIGAGAGAVLGAVTGGSPATGAVVGAGVGAATGYVVGESDKKKDDK